PQINASSSHQQNSKPLPLIKQHPFPHPLKHHLHHLHQQIQLQNPTQQPFIFILNHPNQKHKKPFKQQLLPYIILTLTIITLFPPPITHFPIIFILLQL
ncbi:DUF5345 family protein, partial [Bacillus altitudinis]|uniref:DUF5345 family protein n=1 Tax=Bacillus altitudinis TaxID=293387 RepID=UPI001643E1E6